jgi:dihydroorotate dehydrogenase
LYPLARALLFQLDAERAHHLAFRGLHWADRLGLLRLSAPCLPARPVSAMGLLFPNPVGLAAGLDKNGEHIDQMAALGFGFIEVGTVTPRPQPGNPRPRLFRLPTHQALINRLGFNNLGLEVLLRNVAASRFHRKGGIIGINIGKNFDTPNERAADDYLLCLEASYPLASYITVNVSSPNTRNLRDLQADDALRALLRTLGQSRERLRRKHGRQVPIALKIAPDLPDDEVERIAQTVRSEGFDALIATNTTLARPGVEQHRLSGESGGLSGAPLREGADRVLAAACRSLSGSLPVMGVGGILHGRDADRKFALGASLVQLYTGLIYRGPELVRECILAAPDQHEP